MKGYNGWRNYQTWLMACYINEGLYHYVKEDLYPKVLRKVKDLGITPTKKRLAVRLGNILKEEIYDMFIYKGSENPLVDDILVWVFNSIDWTDIAESYIDDERCYHADIRSI